MLYRKPTPVWGAGDVRLVVTADLAQVKRYAKVRELDVSILCGKDIRCLEVAVYDIVPVQIIQALQDLDHVRRDQFLVQLSESLQGLTKRSIFSVSNSSPKKDINVDASLVLTMEERGDMK